VAATIKVDNDVEVIRTLSECESVDDWVAALKANPAAGSLTSYKTEDAHEFLGLVCVREPDTALCAEASEMGILDFELDDPRLQEID